MIKHQSEVRLAPLHTFHLPTIARSLLCLTDKSQCADLPDQDYVVLGHGSNTIFTEDFERTLVRVDILGKQVTELADGWLLTIGAGESWHELVTWTLQQGYPGLENLALIPGTVGAAPVQNIGAYGAELADFVVAVEAWDRRRHELVSLTKNDCQFGYRDSIFKQHPQRWLIVNVQFKLLKAWQPNRSYAELQQLADGVDAWGIYHQVIAIRQRKLPDPNQIGNAGSFFKNPIVAAETYQHLVARYPNIPAFPLAGDVWKLAAGWLIEQAGWKNVHRGGAYVHPKQALVLCNRGDANGHDLLQLAGEIKADIWQRFAVDLEAEVRLFGKRDLLSL